MDDKKSDSDSDATWPATDDFGSRFLEVDEYEQLKTPIALPRFRQNRGSKASQSTSPPTKTSETRRSRSRRTVIVQDEDTDLEDDKPSPPLPAPTRSTRRRSSIADKEADTGEAVAHSEEEHDNDDDDEEMAVEEELVPFRNPKLMTARQLSLKMQRSASSSGPLTSGSNSRSRLFEPEFLSLESLEPPKPVNKPTPEQLLARQQRIARRRESAKRKVEMEKQQTVERLLKINANSVGLQKRGRGRGRGLPGRPGFSRIGSGAQLASIDTTAGSDENEDDEGEDDEDGDEEEDKEGDQSMGASQRDVSEAKRLESTELAARIALAEQHGLPANLMDPCPGYIRLLSSSRLTPASRLCLASTAPADPFIEFKRIAEPPPTRPLCALGCGRPRRYTCSVTGQPLCSLSCYKQNMNKRTITADRPCA